MTISLSRWFIAPAVPLLISLIPSCSARHDGFAYDGDIFYANAVPGVAYVGSRQCKSCHPDIYSAFMDSEMGRSMSEPDTANLIEEIPQQVPVYDSTLNFSYEMLMDGRTLYQREFRRDRNGAMTHDRRVRVDYIVGSGNNLRMYFHEEGGMLYELPLTWYVHRHAWELSPGYRTFGNLRFNRFAKGRCIGCHNTYLTPDPAARDRYIKPFALGIGCERCHGPGALHVQEKTGERPSSLPEGARTIVNPKALSFQRQLDVCQQCHLQGKTIVIREGKGPFDFRPGTLLSGQRSVYAEAATRKEVFEVADSPHRLALSRCFRESNGSLTCITCHDPHYSIHTFSPDHYNTACRTCHSPDHLSNAQGVHTASADCISCHMNRTGTDNTLHGVSNTDHWIRIDADKTHIDWTLLREAPEKRPLVRLVPDIDGHDGGSMVRLGIAYYQYAHEFDDRVQYLDSALFFVQEGIAQGYRTSGAYCYLGRVLNDQERFQEAADALRESLRLDPDNLESKVLLGDTYRILDRPAEAVAILREALAGKSGDPQIMERLGVALVAADRPDEALQILSRSLTVDGFNPVTYNNLGTLFATRYHQPDSAMAYFTDVLTMDPDFTKIHLNIGNTYAMLGNYREALASYKRQVSTGNDVVGALVNMSAVYRLQGNVQAAEQAMNEAKLRDPSLRK